MFSGTKPADAAPAKEEAPATGTEVNPKIDVAPTQENKVVDDQDQNEKTITPPDVSTGADATAKKRPARKDGEKDTAENEIMVAAKGKIKSYLGYAFRILNKTDYRQLKIKATGNAIVKALILVELIKKKVGEIHSYDLH